MKGKTSEEFENKRVTMAEEVKDEGGKLRQVRRLKMVLQGSQMKLWRLWQE